MEKIKTILNDVIILLGINIIVGMYYYDSIAENGSWNIITLLLLLTLCLNPIHNLFKTNKQIIKNIIYYIIVLPFFTYELIITYSSIARFHQEYNLDYGYQTGLYISSHLLYMTLGTLFLILFGLLFKKQRKKETQDTSRKILFLITLTFLFDTLSTLTSLNVWGLVGFLFSLFLFIKWNSIYIKSDLQKAYAALGILGLLTGNIISIILTIHCYVKLDEYTKTL